VNEEGGERRGRERKEEEEKGMKKEVKDDGERR
jgi:hypothetical protein